MAMALLAVQAEAEARTAIPGEDALLEQVDCCQHWWRRTRRGSADDLPTLVRRLRAG